MPIGSGRIRRVAEPTRRYGYAPRAASRHITSARTIRGVRNYVANSGIVRAAQYPMTAHRHEGRLAIGPEDRSQRSEAENGPERDQQIPIPVHAAHDGAARQRRSTVSSISTSGSIARRRRCRATPLPRVHRPVGPLSRHAREGSRPHRCRADLGFAGRLLYGFAIFHATANGDEAVGSRECRVRLLHNSGGARPYLAG